MTKAKSIPVPNPEEDREGSARKNQNHQPQTPLSGSKQDEEA